jgi:hypothetical protein
MKYILIMILAAISLNAQAVDKELICKNGSDLSGVIAAMRDLGVKRQDINAELRYQKLDILPTATADTLTKLIFNELKSFSPHATSSIIFDACMGN